MPRRGQHDQSPGDARKPFSDEGGPEGRHAATHDVAREEATRPKGGPGADVFADDLAPADVAGAPGHVGGHADESTSAVDDKDLRSLEQFDADDLSQLSVLMAGTRLEQGAVYLELWNRLVDR